MKKAAQPSAVLLGLVFVPWLVAGQPGVSPPSFEVASIKPVVGPLRGSMGFMLPLLDAGGGPVPMPDPGRVAIRNMTLRTLVATAYRVPSTQVSGPGWMGEEAFDVDAKVPPGTPKEQVNEMLQLLLQERFGLVVRRELKNLPGYALLVGKGGARLKPATPFVEPPAGGEQEAELKAALVRKMAGGPRGGRPAPGTTFYAFPHIDGDRLARVLSILAQGPVIDMTGLKGTYEVRLDIATDPALAVDSVLDAVEKLGLELERRRVPTDTLVVDKVSKMPTPN